MRGFRTLVWTNIKLYVREPIGTFFTLAFPPLLVLLFGGIYGNKPQAVFGGLGTMDVSMPAYTALILGTVGLMSIPIVTGTYREQGVLRRYRATPLRPISYIAADVITNLAMTLAGMVLLVLVGWLLFRVQFGGNVLAVILAVILGGLSMFSIGYLIASLSPGARAGQIIGMVIFYPMMFLSGCAFPLELLPASIRRISSFLPLTHVVKLLKGLWFGGSWGSYLTETAVIVGVLVVCTALAARWWKWE
jgi:ABC-2 type transport system permease protein